MRSRTCVFKVLCLLFIAAGSFEFVFGQGLADGEGKDLVAKRCTTCHGAELFTSEKHNKEEWKTVVDAMIGQGADISRSEANVIAAYLAKYYGPDSGK